MANDPIENAKQYIAYADSVANSDPNAAFQYYKYAVQVLQQAGNNAMLQQVMAKIEKLAQSQGAGQQQTAQTQQASATAAQQAYQQPQITKVTPPSRQAGGWLPFVFTHGQEMEVQLVRKDGSFMSGEEMVHLMEELVKDAYQKIKSWMDAQQVPQYILQKMGGYPELYHDHEKGLVMQVPYTLPNGQRLKIDSFGRDGNVAAITYILELVTPPAQFVEELAWWESTLFSLAYEVLPSDLHIVSTALNPMQEYMRGLSFGDHSHIGGHLSPLEKIQMYDMIRNFIPAIISLSVNSPIMKGHPTDVVKVVKGRYAAPNCIRSIRLLKNTTMLSNMSNPDRYIPYILDDSEQNRQYFLQTLQKADYYDARFQDVYPFTDFNTIEVRICDAQLSVARRIGLCMLFQVLGYKTRKILASGRYIPGIPSETICKNRERAIRQGLFGTFSTAGINEQELRSYDPEFANMYLGEPGKKVRYLFQHVQRILEWLAPEMVELGYNRSPYLQPLILSVYGNIPNIQPPFTEADFQLSLYEYKRQNRMDTNLIPDLIKLSKQYSLNNTSHPLASNDINYPPGY
ncbi:MAG: hypothetical protein ACTSWN_11000 [Promethearchaeota archaeon]